MKKLLLMLSFSLFIIQAQAQVNISPETKSAAKELLKAMDMEKQFDLTLDKMMDAQIAQNPQMEQLRDVFDSFYDKYFSYNLLEGKMINLYAESFTVQELKDLTAFYQTPTGKKSVTLMPEITQKAMIIGQQTVQEHLPELQQMIMQRMEALGE